MLHKKQHIKFYRTFFIHIFSHFFNKLGKLMCVHIQPIFHEWNFISLATISALKFKTTTIN